MMIAGVPVTASLKTVGRAGPRMARISFETLPPNKETPPTRSDLPVVKFRLEVVTLVVFRVCVNGIISGIGEVELDFDPALVELNRITPSGRVHRGSDKDNSVRFGTVRQVRVSAVEDDGGLGRSRDRCRKGFHREFLVCTTRKGQPARDAAKKKQDPPKSRRLWGETGFVRGSG